MNIAGLRSRSLFLILVRLKQLSEKLKQVFENKSEESAYRIQTKPNISTLIWFVSEVDSYQEYAGI